jgi:hypothetical protein
MSPVTVNAAPTANKVMSRTRLVGHTPPVAGRALGLEVVSVVVTVVESVRGSVVAGAAGVAVATASFVVVRPVESVIGSVVASKAVGVAVGLS